MDTNIINKLAKLKDKTGALLSDNGLLTHYIMLGEEKYYSLLENPPTTWNDDYFSEPYFDEARLAENRTKELYLGKSTPPESITRCPNCKRTNVRITKTQTQRADEGGKAKAKCNDCSYAFIPH